MISQMANPAGHSFCCLFLWCLPKNQSIRAINVFLTGNCERIAFITGLQYEGVIVSTRKLKWELVNAKHGTFLCNCKGLQRCFIHNVATLFYIYITNLIQVNWMVQPQRWDYDRTATKINVEVLATPRHTFRIHLIYWCI